MGENNNGMVMPVAPALGYGGGGFGSLFGGNNDLLGILFIIALCGGFGGFGGLGGWGMGMMGGMWGMDGLYPWLNNSQNINSGFRDQALNTSVNGIQQSIISGFGDVQTALCGGFAGVNASINGAQSAISQQLYANQLADLERSFAAQTAITGGQNAIQAQLAQNGYAQAAGTADVKYTIATESCNTRQTDTANTQAILDAIRGLNDKLCDQELQAERRENQNLRSELMYARGQASRIEQTAELKAGQVAEIDALYNRLKNCPVGTTPVYGNQPIFTCPGNGNCGFVA